MDVGSIVAVLAILVGWLSGPSGLLIVATALLNFGALAALPPQITGGVTLTAAAAAYVALPASLIARGHLPALLAAARDPRRLGLLSGFTLWAIVATGLMPGLFAGEIHTYPVRSSGPVAVPMPVGYTASNLTQAAYLILSYGIALSVTAAAAVPGFDRTFRRMFLALAALLIGSGVLDLLGLNAVLSIFRTASYTLFSDSVVASTKRVVGAMPEASAYGGACASVFAILLLFRHRFGPAWPWMICTGGTGVLAILSTSSAAYAMVLGTGLAFYAQTAIRLVSGGASERACAVNETALATGLVVLAVLAVLWSDDLSHTAGRIVDEVVLRKALSGSFEERARWTAAALQAFRDSNGLGIGVGSARTSNGFVNILASTGGVGALLFATFAGSIVLRSTDPAAGRDVLAARLALVPAGIGFALVGTTPDYGPVAAILFGLAAHGIGARRSPAAGRAARDPLPRGRRRL